MAIPDGKPATDFNAMNREWVKAIAKEAASSGGLPEVSGADNGDVLTVVSGEWAKAAPVTELPAVTGSDNGDVLTVVEGAWAKASLPASPITYVSVDWVEDTGTMSKTWQEIYNDISAGKIVCSIDAGESGATIYLVSSCINNNGSYEVTLLNFGIIPFELYVYTTDSANGYPSITD